VPSCINWLNVNSHGREQPLAWAQRPATFGSDHPNTLTARELAGFDPSPNKSGYKLFSEFRLSSFPFRFRCPK
jgi:hypothetical protein